MDEMDKAAFKKTRRATIERVTRQFRQPGSPSEQHLRAMLAHVPDIVVFCAIDGTRLFVTPSMPRVLGHSVEEALALTALEVIHEGDKPAALALWGRVVDGSIPQAVECLRYRHKDGRYLWLETSLAPVFEDTGDSPIGVIATLHDVTAHREAEERIGYMAAHDPGTGLPNRNLHRALLGAVLEGRNASDETTSCLIACDLDGFKAVNDTLGHAAGDMVLKIVADRLRVTVRDGDQVARVGGDEFSIIVSSSRMASCHALARRLISAVAAPINVGGQTVHVGMSVGFVNLDAAIIDVDDAVSKADIALYQAKEDGRNTCRGYEAHTGIGIAERRRLRLELEGAFERDQFTVRYQPVVSLSRRCIVSCEALLRWEHPELGEIAPDRFIPLAEENGLIIRLGEWVLRRACLDAIRWGNAIGVAVNVSLAQLRSRMLVAMIRDTLASTGLAPSLLRIEVTETIFMHDGDRALSVLKDLKRIGVSIALDDFGTGYSSMNYLRRFRFDKLKMDKSFVRDIEDERTAAMVKGVIDICRRLGIAVVAEGVETVEQLKLVADEGCDLIQGYLISRPVTIDTLLTTIADGSLLSTLPYPEALSYTI